MSKSKQISTKIIGKIPTKGNDVSTIGANTVGTTNLQDLSVTGPKLADATIPTAKYIDASVTAAKLNTDTVDYILKHYQNLIINGDMTIAQRGQSFAAIGNLAYGVDRWANQKTGAMVHTVTQDTDVPTFAQAGCLYQNSLRYNLTTPDTSIAAGDYAGPYQIIEGYNFAKIAQKEFTLSFWVKATTIGTYCVGFRSAGQDRSYVAEYTINLADTWEKKTITVAASPSAGTWNYTNGNGLIVSWALAGGSTFQTTPGAWQTGNYIATVNQVNGVNTGSTDFRITGVMLNEGSYAAPFRLFANDYAEEFQQCQRYYETGSVSNTGGQYDGANSRIYSYTDFKVTKRINPTTVTTSNFIVNLTGSGANDGANWNPSSLVSNVDGIHWVPFKAGSFLNNYFSTSWTASAEL
jgi:hypothetical protein